MTRRRKKTTRVILEDVGGPKCGRRMTLDVAPEEAAAHFVDNHGRQFMSIRAQRDGTLIVGIFMTSPLVTAGGE